MLYYYDTPISEGHKRRSLKRLQRKRIRRNMKDERKAIIIAYLSLIPFTILFVLALLNSPTMVK